MSNHDGINDEEMNRMRKHFAKEMKLGATGEFPRGKITTQDEGEIRIAVGVENNTVVIHFGKELAWIGFSRIEAIELAETIKKHAMRL